MDRARRLANAANIGIVLALAGRRRPRRTRRPSPARYLNAAKRWREGEWPAYAGTYAAARYSPLTQIDRTNARNLHVAWRWKSPDQAIKDANPKVGPSFANELTPLMVGGMLYTSTSLSQVAAIDAASGETKWVFDPKIYENGLGHSRQPWLAASRRRLLAQRRRRTHRDAHRVRADDRAGRQDRQTRADVRRPTAGSTSRRACAARSTATTTP